MGHDGCIGRLRGTSTVHPRWPMLPYMGPNSQASTWGAAGCGGRGGHAPCGWVPGCADSGPFEKGPLRPRFAAHAPHPTPADLALAEGSPRPTFTRRQGRFAGMRTRSLQLPCVVCVLTGTPTVPSVSGMLPVAAAQGCRVSSIIDQWCTWAHCTGLKFNFGTKAML